MAEKAIDIDYSKMIGDREVQIEAMRIVLQQKDEEIKQLKELLEDSDEK